MPEDAVIVVLSATFFAVCAAAIIACLYAYKKVKNRLLESQVEAETLKQNIVFYQQKLKAQSVPKTDSVALIAKTVLQTINAGVIVLSKSGTIVYLNPYAELHLGRRRDEVIGKSYKVIFRLVNERGEPDDNILGDALEKNLAANNKLSFINQLSGKLPIMCEAIPLSATDGFEGAVFAFSVASEQYAKERAGQIKNADLAKESQRLKNTIETLKNETELTQSAFDGLHSAVFIFDHEGKLLLLNPAAEKLTGTFKSDVLGKPYQQILTLTTRDGQFSYKSIEAALTGNESSFDKWTYIALKNEKIPVTGCAIPLLTRDSSLRILVSIQNATEEFASEEEEKTFFSAAAHDLRTPLTTLRTILELITGSKTSMPKEKLNEMLGNANISLKQLINLVNDLLSVSRIEQGRLEIKKEVFDLIGLTGSVVADMSVLAKEKKLYLNHEQGDVGTAKVLADKSKTQEVLVNLISNAIKYTYQGGVTISHVIKGNTIYTTVKDSGTGISPEHKDLLFRKFQQIGTARLQHTAKSTGLGLYITKKFVQLMGGDLVLVDSEPGKGSSFEFYLPLAPEVPTA